VLPVVSPKYGRQTSRLSETVRLIGSVLGGEAGAVYRRGSVWQAAPIPFCGD
jgi:hypothetical protein